MGIVGIIGILLMLGAITSIKHLKKMLKNNLKYRDGANMKILLNAIKSAFINGYQLAEETMYSEEEVLQLLLRLQQTESYDNLYEWFNQVKKY